MGEWGAKCECVREETGVGGGGACVHECEKLGGGAWGELRAGGGQ